MCLTMLTQEGRAAGDLDVRWSPEFGYFHTYSTPDQTRQHWFGQASLAMRYRESQVKERWQLQFRLRPEFYNYQKSTAILNMSGQAQYRWRWNKIHSAAELSQHYQFYYGGANDQFTDATRVQYTAAFHFQPRYSVDVSLGYFQRKITGDTDHRLQAPNGAVRLVFYSDKLTVSSGCYTEYYEVKRPATYSPSRRRGWGIGPEATIEYNGGLFANLTYRLVVRSSDAIGTNDHEHHFSGIWGRSLGNRLACFVYADYTFREVGRRGDLAFYSTNNENRIYAKLSLEEQKSLEWYLKVGYLRYEMYGLDSEFSGVNVSAGIEWRN